MQGAENHEPFRLHTGPIKRKRGWRPRKPRVPKHGTRREYTSHGCRCELCREASKVYYKKQMENPETRAKLAEGWTLYAAKNRDRCAAASRRWRERNPEKLREAQKRNFLKFRLKQYALTAERHAELLAQQDGRCAVCRATDNRALSVDHEHATGRIRGLLCRRCNLGLGCFGDNPEFLDAAIRYLRESR